MEGYNKTKHSHISRNAMSNKSSNTLSETEKHNFIYRRQLLLATNTKKYKNYLKHVQQEISKANDAKDHNIFNSNTLSETEKHNFIYRRQLLLATNTKKYKNYLKHVQQEISKANDAKDHNIFNSNIDYNILRSKMNGFSHLLSNNKIPQLVSTESFANKNIETISSNKLAVQTKSVIKIETINPFYDPFESVFVKAEENTDIPTNINQANNKEMIIKQEKKDFEETMKQEKEGNYQEELDIKEESDIKEEVIKEIQICPTSESSPAKTPTKPLINTLKRKEFTGYNLFAVNQRNVIRAKKPKAHFMEIQHEIRKDWFCLTTKARQHYETKAIRIRQERECLNMLKRIKEGHEADDQKRPSELAKNPPQELPQKKTKQTTKISSHKKRHSNEVNSMVEITPKLQESQIHSKLRLRKCFVLLKDCNEVAAKDCLWSQNVLHPPVFTDKILLPDQELHKNGPFAKDCLSPQDINLPAYTDKILLPDQELRKAGSFDSSVDCKYCQSIKEVCPSCQTAAPINSCVSPIIASTMDTNDSDASITHVTETITAAPINPCVSPIIASTMDTNDSNASVTHVSETIAVSPINSYASPKIASTMEYNESNSFQDQMDPYTFNLDECDSFEVKVLDTKDNCKTNNVGDISNDPFSIELDEVKMLQEEEKIVIKITTGSTKPKVLKGQNTCNRPIENLKNNSITHKIRRSLPCFYCQKLFKDLPQHYFFKHKSESDVIEARKNPKQRKQIINKLRKKGITAENLKRLALGEPLILARHTKKNGSIGNCMNCGAWMTAKGLLDHKRRCYNTKQARGGNVIQKLKDNPTRKDFFHPNFEDIIGTLRDDKTGKTIREDDEILYIGNDQFNDLLSTVRTKCNIRDRVARTMQSLAHIKLGFANLPENRTTNEHIKLSEILSIERFISFETVLRNLLYKKVKTGTLKYQYILKPGSSNAYQTTFNATFKGLLNYFIIMQNKEAEKSISNFAEHFRRNRSLLLEDVGPVNFQKRTENRQANTLLNKEMQENLKNDSTHKIRRSLPCFYCQKFFKDLPQHYFFKHKTESDVIEARKNPKQRKQIFKKLRKKGITAENEKRLGLGEPLILARRTKKNGSIGNCKNCGAWMTAKGLSGHKRRCYNTKQARGGNVIKKWKDNPTRKDFFHPNFEDIIETLRDDKTGKTIREDDEILHIGNDQFKDLLSTVRTKVYIRDRVATTMRSLAHIKLGFANLPENRTTNEQIKLSGILSIERFLSFKRVLKNLLYKKVKTGTSKYQYILKPGSSNSYQTTFNATFKGLLNYFIIMQNKDAENSISNFAEHFRRNRTLLLGNVRVGLVTSQKRTENCQANTLLSKEMRERLKNECETKIKQIMLIRKDKLNESIYVDLRSAVITRLVFFNNRRLTEELSVNHWQLATSRAYIPEEAYKVASASEMQSINKFVIIFNLEKRSEVPVLVYEKYLIEAVNLLANKEVRNICGILQSNDYLFPSTKNSDRYSDGYNNVRLFLKNSSIDDHTSAVVMQYFVTTSIGFLEVPESVRPVLAKFLGHVVEINKKVNSCTQAIAVTTMIRPILKMLDSDNSYPSTSASRSNDEDYNMVDETSSDNDDEKMFSPKKKRTRKAMYKWTKDQEAILLERFHNFIYGIKSSLGGQAVNSFLNDSNIFADSPKYDMAMKKTTLRSKLWHLKNLQERRKIRARKRILS